MLRLLLYFLAWVATGTGAYFWISPVALVFYAVGSLLALLGWAIFFSSKKAG